MSTTSRNWSATGTSGSASTTYPLMDEPLPVENVVPQYTELYGEEQYPPMNRLAIAGPSVIAPLTELMVGHGYSDDQVRGILGGNFLRVFGQVWGSQS